jgi:hypothetical protein
MMLSSYFEIPWKNGEKRQDACKRETEEGSSRIKELLPKDRT